MSKSGFKEVPNIIGWRKNKAQLCAGPRSDTASEVIEQGKFAPANLSQNFSNQLESSMLFLIRQHGIILFVNSYIKA